MVARRRYAYIAAHFDGFTDHILCVVRSQENITKPEICLQMVAARQNTAGGEISPVPQGRRVALHHCLTPEIAGYGAWRDGGLKISRHQRSARPRLHVSHNQTGSAVSRRYTYGAPAARTKSRRP